MSSGSSANFSMSRRNFAMNVIDLPSNDASRWLYGFGVNNFVDSGKSELELLWSMATPNDLSDKMDGAVLLPRDALETGRQVHGEI
jgi:hypothetical protein